MVACPVRSSEADLTVIADLLAMPLFRGLPKDALQFIVEFVKHIHDYDRVWPAGPRDNGDCTFVCRTCGHQL